METLSSSDDAFQLLGGTSSWSARGDGKRDFRGNLWVDTSQFDALARPRVSSSFSARTHILNLDDVLQARLTAIHDDLLANQTTLPEDAQRALSEDRWAMYETV